ncbi:MAG: response regulator transcription factor [Pseudomonadota bacterium]
MTISVVLVDDQKLVRDGIRSLLELSHDVKVIAEAATGLDALEQVKSHAPDVVLMDIQMPQMNGIEAIDAMTAAGLTVPVIILTTFDDHELVLQGLRAGARGYLLKDVSLEDLIDAIQLVHQGGTMVRPAITDTLLRAVDGADSAGQSFDTLPEPEALTARELEVLRLVAGGYSNREISDSLKRSEGTVKNHVSNVLSKLGVRDRTRAVLRAIELGLL